MKYSNFPAKLRGEGELLYFVQQLWIRAGNMRRMLYFVQDYIKL